MAHEAYLKVTGTKQKALKGESPRDIWKDHIPVLGFDYALLAPRDAATGAASGKRSHRPIKITKEWGPSTPQLFTACATGETLTEVVLNFVKINPAGEEYVYHTITLTGATISEVHQYVGANAKNDNVADTMELEDISFTFESIQIENKDGKTIGSDKWSK